LNHFYDDFRGRKRDEVLSLLAARAGKNKPLAIVFRSISPGARKPEFRTSCKQLRMSRSPSAHRHPL